MKRLFTALIAIAAISISSITMTGCTTMSTSPEVAYKTSYCFGITASLIMKMKKVPASTTDGVFKTLDGLSQTIPPTNMTFTVTWDPLINARVKELLEKKEIDAEQAEFIKIGAQLATGVLDYEMKRHPKWKKDVELTRCVLDGFMNGMYKYLKPSNDEDEDDEALDPENVLLDEEQSACYHYFMTYNVIAAR